MKRNIAVLELEADEESIEADVRYNYRSDGEDYSVLGCVWFKEENKKTYEDGLNEAWELARNIICKPDERSKVFGIDVASAILKNYTVLQAIAKVKEHEEIKVGDEVENIDTYDRVIVTHINQYTKQIDILWEDGSVGIRAPIEKFKKTGRYFPQIEQVLKKIQED